jgi:uncharacterized membrane protein YphA (DoxX/SURF4 family)
MNKKPNLSFPSRRVWGWLTLSVILAAVFVVAGLSKALRPAELEKVIRTYHVIPTRYAHWGALALPWFELLVGGLLLWPRRRSFGAAGAIMLLSLFTAAGTLAWAQGLHPTCGCFGRILELGQRVGPTWFTRNVLLTVGAVAVFFHSFLRPPATQGSSFRQLQDPPAELEVTFPVGQRRRVRWRELAPEQQQTAQSFLARARR